MKKALTTTFLVLTLLTISVTPVFAGSALELIEVRNDSGAPVFVFLVAGEFTKQELNTGFIHVSGGDDYILHCGQKSETTVTCYTTKKAAGHNVMIIFGNARFWTYAPLPANCYSIWDWLIPPDAPAWMDFGLHCQGQEANPGDEINYYNQYSGTYETVMFFDIYTPLSGTCAILGYPPSNGPAYYFPDCP
jgi:hypothetical protein